MKIWNYVFLFITIILILQFSGMGIGTPQVIGNFTEIGFENSTAPCPSCITTFNPTGSSLFDYLFSTGAITGILIGLGIAIAASFFVKGQAENFILLPFITGILGLFIQVFASIFVYANSAGIAWATSLIALIVIPLSVAYVLAMIEFFRGSD